MSQPNQKEAEKKLEQIKADILDQNICPDLAQGATQLVMGHGNPTADLVFIGEAPGKNEDQQGIPFVGAAGKLLDEMLANIQLQRKDVYITNIVKYRPPNNRDPLPEEKKAFWPYLVKELQVLQPKIIATLGRHSMEYFLPGRKITEVHGQPFRIKVRYGSVQTPGDNGEDDLQGSNENRSRRTNGTSSESRRQLTQQSASSDSRVSASGTGQGIASVVLLPLYHPAAALYNGSLRQTLFDDFAGVPTIIKQIQLET